MVQYHLKLDSSRQYSKSCLVTYHYDLLLDDHASLEMTRNGLFYTQNNSVGYQCLSISSGTRRSSYVYKENVNERDISRDK